MFAHKVVKDLGREAVFLQHEETDGFEDWQSKQKFKDTLNDIIPLIIQSKKYHFGNIMEDVVGIIEPSVEAHEKKSKEDVVLFETFSEYLIFPYDLMWFDWFHPGVAGRLIKMGALIKHIKVKDEEEGIDEDMHLIYIFAHRGGYWIMYPDFMIIVGDTKDGYNIGKASIIDEHLMSDEYKSIADTTQHVYQKLIYSILLFLNCRNVKVCAQRPDKALVKKQKKRGQLPLFTYHVLEIEDMRKRSAKSNDNRSTVSKGIQRYHEMPARVAYYTKERPLFGNPKLHGLFAFKSHWKGDPNKGIIIKDYKIKAKGGSE